MINHPHRSTSAAVLYKELTGSDIYKQHEASFSRVSAYVITDNTGERVATIAFKFPADGAGRLYAYLHVLGLKMVRGHAGGYGYDKQSAALSSAASCVPVYSEEDLTTWQKDASTRDLIVAALMPDDGFDWSRHLRDAGFNVLQAV